MEDGGVVEKKMTENFSKLEDLKTTLMDKSEPDQSESDHDSDSDPDFPKRVIKCKGGYGPPPMIFTYEELTEIFKPQDNGVAEAGLKLLNQRRAADGKSGYELVVAQDSAYFRTKQGLMYHGNFVAKPSDDHNAKNELFLFVCTSVSRVYQAIDCISLGFVDTGTPLPLISKARSKMMHAVVIVKSAVSWIWFLHHFTLLTWILIIAADSATLSDYLLQYFTRPGSRLII